MNAIVLRSIVVAVAMFFVGGCITPTHAAEKKLAHTKQYVEEVKDWQKCIPFNDAATPNPKGKSVQPRLRRGYEPWEDFKDIPPQERKKTVTAVDPQDHDKTVELPVTSTQSCDPKTRVYKTVQGFPYVMSRESSFRYCTCTIPGTKTSATARLVPDLKYDRKSHVICEGDLACPPKPKSKK